MLLRGNAVQALQRPVTQERHNGIPTQEHGNELKHNEKRRLIYFLAPFSP
jgi:hypothetical protein